jgi:hypothetical protein
MLLVQTLLARRELQTTLFCRFEIPQHRCRESCRNKTRTPVGDNLKVWLPGMKQVSGTKPVQNRTDLRRISLQSFFGNSFTRIVRTFVAPAGHTSRARSHHSR